MGCLFAAKLSGAGAEVTLIDYKPERAAQLGGRIQVEEDGAVSEYQLNISADPAAIEGSDGVIFMVKAYATREAAERLREHVSPGAWVMCVQNGMGNVEILSEIFGVERVLAGTSSHGATLLEPGKIRHAGKGPTFIGKADAANPHDPAPVAELFASAGFETSVSDNVRSLLWKKLLINVGINPLTALLRIKNGELLERESALDVSRTAVYEAALIAEKDGVDFQGEDPFELVKDIMAKTAGNISSMHQDIAAGRRTEIDFICGYVVERARQEGMMAAMNAYLFEAIKTAERGEGGKE